ncbi:valyl-tRNA synthetase-like protein [Acephala macrosclerotiorum]|nr:valyl-tRNA synthetase-like protein [Acephala macrosclerotiorum]
MATNAASYNPISEETGPVSGNPPPVPNETKAALKDATNSSATGSHTPGQDAGSKVGTAQTADGEKKVKSEKELERERKKAEKQAKFDQKKAKAASAAPAATSKSKEKKAKAEKEAEKDVLPPYVEETPFGEKKLIKSFDDPQYRAYNPTAVESAWYSWWEKEGFFKPEFTADGKVKPEGSFVIVEPPPNVTGNLHMGHALGNALQDVMIRWNRMNGKTTLWLPGCDHAGISTQSVVENMLWRRQQKTRHDLGRPKFVDTVWEWKNEYHTKINTVLRRMGGSFDWTREAFTMNDNFSAAVTETFVTLHEQGIIYRANRLVNWCTKLNTSLSNLEVVNKELSGRTLLDVPGYDKKVEFGIIVHFKYEIEGTDEKIEVATTRPETMLGDTGVAVHPDDERYKHLVGKNAIHPFIPGRLMPIVADTYVEKDFGTGAVKITPAHDPNDFALGTRHNLEFINILTDDGKMNENAGPYVGQKRFDVRYTIQEDLKKAGLYVDKKDNAMTVPLCDKSKDVIEPLLKPQWWMKMKDMAAAALKVVEDGEIKILPESAEKSYKRWMSDVNDWCLSRQLWWGHQAPMYFCKIYGEEGDEADNDLWFAGRTQKEAEAKARAKYPGKNFTLHRDEDVLDTWFSSGLWPFATLGWPNKTHDLETLFPTSVLETGWDILFFWIARMVMFSLKLTGKVPFTEVYCHSLIRDSEGRKMSKSLGNVIDPQDVIEGIKLDDLHAKLLLGNLAPAEVEKATKYQKTAFPDGIPQCGTDALRFALVSYTTGGGDIAFDVKVIHGYRKFCNKIYQATKYVLGKLDADFVPQKTGKLTGKESLAERWILHKLTIAAKEVNQALADREFQKSTSIVYAYWYNQLCDVYIENSKAILQDGTPEEKRSALDTLYTALESALTMISPYMPFLTEELWQRLPRRPEDETKSIVLAKYPTYDESMDDPTSEAAYELVLGVSRGIRSLMAEYSLKDEGKVFIQTHDPTAHTTVTTQIQSIKSLSGKGVSSLSVLSTADTRPPGCVVFSVSSSASVFLHVKGRVDIDGEISKASKKLEKTKQGIDRQQKILGDEGYKEKVAKELQEVEMRKLADLETERKAFEETIKQFEALKTE